MERRGAVSASGHRRANVRDRRVDRTYRELLSAFRDLMFERGYSRITVRALIARANVGRSTFYEHFRNKEDVLRESIAPILTPLAAAVASSRAAGELRWVVEHMWSVRARAGTTILGPTRPLVARLLAELLADRLEELAASLAAPPARVPLRMIAAALADAQIGLLASWMREEHPASAEAIAESLARLSAGAARAVVGAAPAARTASP
jgi:AcrR family transcriptional regulator